MRTPSCSPFRPIPHLANRSFAAPSISSPPRSGIVTTASSAPVFCCSSIASASIESEEAGSTTCAKSLRWPVGFGQSRAHATGAWHAAAQAHARISSVQNLRGDPRLTARAAASRGAIVRELEVQPKVVPLDGLDDRLQIVALLPAHAHLVLLDLRLDPDSGSLDEFDDLLGLLRGDPLLDGDDLPHRALGRRLHLPVVQGPQRDAALDQLPLQNVHDRLQLVLVVRREGQRLLIEYDVARASLEVEPLADLLHGLLDGIRSLHQVHVRDDVERVVSRHRSSQGRRRTPGKRKGKSGAEATASPPSCTATLLLCELPISQSKKVAVTRARIGRAFRLQV